MTHLGERVSALLDGQLDAEATERAMAHLAGCRECRDAVELERLIKARLAFLSDPEPSGDLVGRLLALGGPSGPLPPRPGHVPGTPRPKPVRIQAPQPVPAGAAVRTLVRNGAVRTVVPVAVRSAVGRAVRVRPSVRSVAVRPPAGPMPVPTSRRPGGRRGRARLAGAVIGALGVVGAGVGGLVLTAPALTAGGFSPAADNLSVQQPSTTVPRPTPTPSPQVSLTRLTSPGLPTTVPVSLRTAR